jgi:Sec-independent protein translocase protein TatA
MRIGFGEIIIIIFLFILFFGNFSKIKEVWFYLLKKIKDNLY